MTTIGLLAIAALLPMALAVPKVSTPPTRSTTKGDCSRLQCKDTQFGFLNVNAQPDGKGG